MPVTDARLHLIRDAVLTQLITAGNSNNDIAKTLGLSAASTSLLAKRLRQKRKLSERETQLRARLRAFARKNGPIILTITTEDL